MIILLDFRSFAFYHPSYNQWICEDGEYDILIGASSVDIRCTQTVTLQSTQELPCILDRVSTVREWQSDPRGKSLFDPVFKILRVQMAGLFGAGEENSQAIGMDMEGFMLDMPLLDLLQFNESGLPQPASDLVDTLLADVHRIK